MSYSEVSGISASDAGSGENSKYSWKLNNRRSASSHASSSLSARPSAVSMGVLSVDDAWLDALGGGDIALRSQASGSRARSVSQANSGSHICSTNSAPLPASEAAFSSSSATPLSNDTPAELKSQAGGRPLSDVSSNWQERVLRRTPRRRSVREQPSSGSTPRVPPAGVVPSEPRSRCVKQFEKAPMQHTTVDQVAFNRPGDPQDQLPDAGLAHLFRGSAGRGSWELGTRGTDTAEAAPARTEGRRVYPFSPTLLSTVDEVVFGADLDFSEGKQEQFLEQFEGAHGSSSWSTVAKLSGLKTWSDGKLPADIAAAGNAQLRRSSDRRRKPRGRTGR